MLSVPNVSLCIPKTAGDISGGGARIRRRSFLNLAPVVHCICDTYQCSKKQEALGVLTLSTYMDGYMDKLF